MLRVCAWCGPKAATENGDVSHGICLSCMRIYFPEAHATLHPQEDHATPTTLDDIDALHSELDALIVASTGDDT